LGVYDEWQYLPTEVDKGVSPEFKRNLEFGEAIATEAGKAFGIEKGWEVDKPENERRYDGFERYEKYEMHGMQNPWLWIWIVSTSLGRCFYMHEPKQADVSIIVVALPPAKIETP